MANTATEYMFQMATIGYHVLTGTQTVVLDPHSILAMWANSPSARSPPPPCRWAWLWSGLFAGVGVFAFIAGLGLVWAASKDEMFNIKRLVAEMERKEEASIG